MMEKHAVIIVSTMVRGRERRVPLVGRLTGMRNPDDDREIEFNCWTKKAGWRKIFVPQDAIASMATFEAEYKDVGSGI